MSESITTRNHDVIRQWVEERKGIPSIVKGTDNSDRGILRINFPGFSGEETLEEISWDEFFSIFDEKNLSFLYQETTEHGELSRFFKFIHSMET